MDWVFLLLTASTLMLVVFMARMFAFRDAAQLVPAHDTSLDKQPDFDVLAERSVFGTRLTELVDRRDAFEDRIELATGPDAQFTRVSILFPTRLRIGIHLALESEEGLLKRLMNMKETSVGHDAFDSQFIVLASSQTRVERTFNDAMRAQMLELREDVDELRITDEAVFVRVPLALDAAALDHFLPRVQSLAHTYYERAQEVDEEVREETERNPEHPSSQRESAFGITGRQTWKLKK